MVLDITQGLEVGVNGPHGENVQELVEQVLVLGALSKRDTSLNFCLHFCICCLLCIGAQFRSRQCDNPRPAYGGQPCIGEREEFRLCSIGNLPIYV